MIVRITDEKDEFFGFTEQARADITHEHCRIFIAVSFIWMLKGAVNRSLIVPYQENRCTPYGVHLILTERHHCPQLNMIA